MEYTENLANKHSDIVSIEDVGRSYEGRPMRVLRVGCGTIYRRSVLLCKAKPQKKVLYTCSYRTK